MNGELPATLPPAPPSPAFGLPALLRVFDSLRLLSPRSLLLRSLSLRSLSPRSLLLRSLSLRSLSLRSLSLRSLLLRSLLLRSLSRRSLSLALGVANFRVEGAVAGQGPRSSVSVAIASSEGTKKTTAGQIR